MRWSGRGRAGRLPDDGRAALDLRAGERVLAAAAAADGTWLAATEAALVGAGVRVAWWQVAHARWVDDERALVVDPVPGEFAALRVRLPEPGRLPETVHERVMASIVLSRRVALPGGRGARVVARRDGSSPLVWQVLADAGVDLGATDVRRIVDESVLRLQRELGEAPA